MEESKKSPGENPLSSVLFGFKQPYFSVEFPRTCINIDNLLSGGLALFSLFFHCLNYDRLEASIASQNY